MTRKEREEDKAFQAPARETERIKWAASEIKEMQSFMEGERGSVGSTQCRQTSGKTEECPLDLAQVRSSVTLARTGTVGGGQEATLQGGEDMSRGPRSEKQEGRVWPKRTWGPRKVQFCVERRRLGLV